MKELIMKKCPYCAEEIQDEAIKCKHCGEWLKKDTQAAAQLVKASEIEIPQPEPVEITSAESAEEIRKKEAGLKKCPTCGKWDVYRAYIEDGGMGDWCPHCKKSIQPPPQFDEYQELNSIGGWLGFFVFYCCLGTLMFLKELVNAQTLAELLPGILIIILLLTPAIGIMKRWKYAPIAAKAFLILIIIIGIIAILSNFKENVIMLVSLLVNSMWLIYFFVSKRVKVVFYPEKLGLSSTDKNKN